MWNKEIWAFSAISVNFWLPSECRADWFRGKSPKYGVFLNISLVGTYIRVIPSFSWSLRWNRSTGMTFTWNLIQISPTILNLFVVSRFEIVEPCNTIFRQMRLWLSIHVFKTFSSVLFHSKIQGKINVYISDINFCLYGCWFQAICYDIWCPGHGRY